MSNREQIDQIGQNREELAEELNRFRNKALSFIRKRWSEMHDLDSEDIFQEILSRLFHLHDITIPVKALGSYLFSALRNRIIDLSRKKITVLSLDEHHYEGSTSDESANLYTSIEDFRYSPNTVQQRIEEEELQSILFAAMDQLSSNEQKILYLNIFSGMSFQEISQQTGEPVGTLLSRKSRALTKLRIILSDNDEIKTYL